MKKVIILFSRLHKKTDKENGKKIQNQRRKGKKEKSKSS